jgi:hypothetical protein
VFSFLYSEQKKMRQTAENWLEVADRVFKYRRDQLNESQTKKLLGATGELKLRLKEKADASKLKMSVESLEGILRDTGGRIYPVSSIVENVEFFLVAAIVILGLRAYFVQPFKIPTNSMWPTYYGMTARNPECWERCRAWRGSVRRIIRQPHQLTDKSISPRSVIRRLQCRRFTPKLKGEPYWFSLPPGRNSPFPWMGRQPPSTSQLTLISISFSATLSSRIPAIHTMLWLKLPDKSIRWNNRRS